MLFTRSHFDPLEGMPLAEHPKPGEPVVRRFDDAVPASTYVYEDPLVLAINVALATRRPLLLAGEPGSGKTTVARNVALIKQWAFYSHTVASRSQASELLWDMDTLARLNDAYNRQRRLWPEECYVQPGPMWWALSPSTARYRGLPADHAQREDARLPDPPGHLPSTGAVLLIDEIDKAEPDVPNDLLEVLDTRRFSVKGRPIAPERDRPLIVVTTNLERDLPAAFMRRCVAYHMPEPEKGWYTRLAMSRKEAPPEDLAKAVEDRLIEARKTARARDQRPPGSAEYLDAVAALVALGVTSHDDKTMREAWDQVERCIFGKQATVEGS